MYLSKRILVIDDDPEVAEILRIALSKRSEVRTSPSREDALVTFKEWSPEILFLDFNMPGLTASEFLSELTLISTRLPRIVLLTAANEAEKRARVLGIPEYLQKPFDPLHVFESIEICVG
jgi:DNA-binding response OmpR family regulator